MRTDDKIKQRVQKLLNQARDQEGTPEGDAFYARAFELMAQYGYEQRDLRDNDDGSEVGQRAYEFSGAYTDMQANLLLTIARALHCSGFTQRVYNSTRIKDAVIFGCARHLERVDMLYALEVPGERVDMLYALLQPAMLADAQLVRASHWGESAVVRRRSFMSGFASSIGTRLAAAEKTVEDSDSGYGLVLLGDYDKAAAARDEFAAAEGFVLSGYSSKRSFDPDAYSAGHAAGERSDIGQTRVRARPALPC